MVKIDHARPSLRLKDDFNRWVAGSSRATPTPKEQKPSTEAAKPSGGRSLFTEKDFAKLTEQDTAVIMNVLTSIEKYYDAESAFFKGFMKKKNGKNEEARKGAETEMRQSIRVLLAHVLEDGLKNSSLKSSKYCGFVSKFSKELRQNHEIINDIFGQEMVNIERKLLAPSP